MPTSEEDVRLLTEIGFSHTQARVYLTLLSLEKADGKTLAGHSKVPRQEIYRVLTELEENGFVEKIITAPLEFKATPIRESLEILLKKKWEEQKETVKKTELLLEKFGQQQEKAEVDREYRITMLKGKERLLQLIRSEHDKAQSIVEFISATPRWLQIIEECGENYEKALDRGVKYRGIMQVPAGGVCFPKNALALLAKPDFELRLVETPCSNNCAIFDGKEATFNFRPAKLLAESPLIWTNHPSLIAMCKDHFDTVWKTAKTCKDGDSAHSQNNG